MGHLTGDMSRLRGEIGSMRRARHAFEKKIQRDVATIQTGVLAMRDGFRAALDEGNRTARGQRISFVSNLRRSVDDLKRNVVAMRTGFAADIVGGRQAWRGSSFAGRQPAEESPGRMEPVFRGKDGKAGAAKPDHKKHSGK